MLSPGVVLQQRYRIKRLLARGGMGAVYEAEAVHLRNVIVAVKETLYNEDRKNMREQFEREAATLARLRHPALLHRHMRMNRSDWPIIVGQFAILSH